MAKNTLELIILPVFRQVLPAKRFGFRRRGNSKRRCISQGPPQCPQDYSWARGIRWSLGLGSSDSKRSIPTNIPRQIVANRLLEDVRELNRLLLATQPATRSCESRAKFARTSACAHKQGYTSRWIRPLGERGKQFKPSESFAGNVISILGIQAANGRSRFPTS
jgi:hypothetical protein